MLISCRPSYVLFTFMQVGSLVEEEPERGVAHILEHLAFNATQV
jgi:predicted Zn-dependent peptidase